MRQLSVSTATVVPPPNYGPYSRAHDLAVRPPRPLERMDHELDASKALLRQHKPLAALSLLSDIHKQFTHHQPDPPRLHRFFQHRSAAYAQLGRFTDSLAAAETALTHDPDGLHALLSAAIAALALGNLDIAQDRVDRALLKHPDDPTAWLLTTDIASAQRVALPLPPASIRTSPLYRTGLCNILLNQGQLSQVIQITDELLADDVRTPEVLVVRARALVTNNWGDVGVYEPQVAQEAETLASEALQATPDDETMRQAYFIRAVARGSLGRPEDADADVRCAYDLQPTDPTALLQSAQTELNAGRFESAYRILSTPLVEEYPILLALRAAAQANLRRTALAIADVDVALSSLSKAHDPDAVRLACADAALHLGDQDLFQRSLTGLSSTAASSSRHALARGRMAFLLQDADHGQEWLEEAARRDDHMRSGILAELGCRLFEARRPAAAVEAFGRVQNMPPKVVPVYVDALIVAREVQKADTLVHGAMTGTIIEDWVLDAAVRIAVLREDLENAVKHLKALLTRPGVTHDAHLELVRLLIRLRRVSEAQPLVEPLLAVADTLAARQQMALAHAAHSLGRLDDSLRMAFQAYRRGEDDPELHRAFATLAMSHPAPRGGSDAVGANSHVKLQSVDGEEALEYTIVATPPIRPRNGEMLVGTAQALGLMGRAVGDTFTLEQSWGPGRWRVVEIQSAIDHTVQDILINYAGRFPTADFFVKGFSLAENGGVRDFAPMIGTLHARGQNHTAVVKLYAEQVLPLGFVTTATGQTTDHAMGYLTSSGSEFPLWTEWTDIDGQQSSLAAVAGATRVAIAETALWTAHERGLLGMLAKHFEVVVPRALLDHMYAALDELERQAREGYTVMTSDGPGLQLREWPAGAPALVARCDGLRARIDWLENNAEVVPRPLEALTAANATVEGTESALGRSAYCCVELAVHDRATLYADDLGLRRIAGADGGRSFSTIALVEGLAQAGSIRRAEADEHLLWLAAHRYNAVPMTTGLMRAALRSLRGTQLVDVLALAGPPAMQLDAVAKMGAAVLKWMATNPVGASLAAATEALLAAMARHWGPQGAGYALARAATDEFLLLPRHLAPILAVCDKRKR